MTCLNKTVKRVFSIVMTVLVLCITLSPSVFAETLAASTAEQVTLQTETPSPGETSPVTCNNTGVFEDETMTVWGLCDHTMVEQYLTLFDDNEAVHKVELLKNGEEQTSGYLEDGMTVRLYQNEDDYLDYTVVGMDTASQPSDTLTTEQSTLVATPSTLATTQSTTNSYGLVLPIDNMGFTNDYITTYFEGTASDSHKGIDIAWGDDMQGKPIKAVLSGTASILYDERGYGNYIVVDHGLVNGEYLKTLYAHMDSAAISDGQVVTKGQTIGYVGNTGNSYGAHLHFEVRVGTATSIYSCTPVNPISYLTGAGNATNPVGNYESALGGGGTVTVKGWAFDNDDTSASIKIHVYIGGPAGSSGAIGYSLGATTVTRSDVNNAHNIVGAHGFEKKIVTSKRGSQEVYVYAINIGDGTNTLLGCKTVTITGNPVGSYDGASATAGTVRVYGWAFDYDEPYTALRIHVYIGGPAGSSNAIGYSVGNTSIERSDVNSLYNITGKHGFDFTITTSKRGSQEVYVYAINVGVGSNKLLGHKSVTITGNPVGEFESATGGVGTVTVKGWAFDYDNPSVSISIHVYIGGLAGSSDTIGYSLGATDITRNEVNNAYSISGDHGFYETISTTKTGTQTVYVYAINVEEGSNTLLGYKAVTIT